MRAVTSPDPATRRVSSKITPARSAWRDNDWPSTETCTAPREPDPLAALGPTNVTGTEPTRRAGPNDDLPLAATDSTALAAAGQAAPDGRGGRAKLTGW